MKIAIDAHILGDKSGGNETYYRNILTYLPEFMSSADEIHLLFSDKQEMKIWMDKSNDKIKCSLFKSKSGLKRYLFELPKYVKKNEIDILHTQYYLPFKNKCLTVVTIHDISYEHYPQYFKFLHVIRNKIWIKYAAKISDAILTVSEYSKSDIVEKYNVSKDKVFVTYNATKSQFRHIEINEDNRYIFQKFSLTDDYILSVGNLQPRKNLISLIQAYVSLREKNEMITHQLVIVGKKAWKYSNIFENLSSNKFRDSIILTDYVSDEELALLYNYADIFVYPSYFEGFGLPPLEAMACGTPVITSNVTSLPEVVGDAAILINPFDIDEIEIEMKNLILSSDLKEKMINKGFERAGYFSWRKTSELIYDIYKSIYSKTSDQLYDCSLNRKV